MRRDSKLAAEARHLARQLRRQRKAGPHMADDPRGAACLCLEELATLVDEFSTVGSDLMLELDDPKTPRLGALAREAVSRLRVLLGTIEEEASPR